MSDITKKVKSLPLVEQVAYYKDKCKAIEKLQEENEALKAQLEEANQEIASLQQCDCIIRSAE